MSRGHVMYSSNGDEKWWRVEWEPQCKGKAFLAGRCQGVAGHKDVHWCFGPDGSFCWSDNKSDRRHDGGSGRIPPGHRTYRTPQSMQKRYYMTRRTWKRVTNANVVARLEKNDKAPEKDASINRPVTDPAILAKVRRRLSAP